METKYHEESDTKQQNNLKFGYSFKKSNSGGLGAIIHDVLLAFTYAKSNNLQFYFTKEGYDIPRLNGSTIDETIADHNWHTFFKTFSICDETECAQIWTNLIPGTINPDCLISWYSKLTKYICSFNQQIEDKIYELVKETPFNKETDLVVHVRRTDKTFDLSEKLKNNFLKKKIESDPISLETYVYISKIYLKKHDLKRIYIYTVQEIRKNRNL